LIYLIRFISSISNVSFEISGAYWPDGEDNKPWTNKELHAANSFYSGKNDWYPTWVSPTFCFMISRHPFHFLLGIYDEQKEDDAALQVDYIKVYSR
jgi:hypothetical protein